MLFEAPLGDRATLGGFANYTLAHLLDEEVLEPTITARDRLTWHTGRSDRPAVTNVTSFPGVPGGILAGESGT